MNKLSSVTWADLVILSGVLLVWSVFLLIVVTVGAVWWFITQPFTWSIAILVGLGSLMFYGGGL